MSLKGNPTETLRRFGKQLQALSTTAAVDIAAKLAPQFTARSRAAYDGGQTVYGAGRPAGKRGALDLVESGAVRGQLGFTAAGRILRARLSTRYAKYLVRYGILPNGKLPEAWQQDILEVSRDVLSQAVSP